MPAESRRTHQDSTRSRGARHERYAEQWLIQRGLQLLNRNYTCRGGEIDLVMQDGETIVFVEVRYRRNDHYGSAAESVDMRKQQRLTLAARHYLARYPQHNEYPCRFDVVALSGALDALRVDWIENAFSA